jgi:kinetochore protein Mis13/DSN1
MHQSSHAAVQYSATATKFLDGIFASLAQDLRNRDQLGAPSTLKDNNNDQDGPALSVAGFVSEIRPGPAATSSKPRNALELLKSLSADDDAEQDDALLTDLNPLPLMSNSLNVPSGSAGMSSTRTISAQSNHSTNGSGSTTMTPRRPGSGLGGITPRKIGMLTAPTPRRDNSKRAVSPAMLI